jgi:penicillin-binding protein 2
MSDIIKKRFIAAAAVLLSLIALIVVQLMNLQIRQGAAFLDESMTKKTREITLKGERGKILDENGIVLAYDEQSYNVEFYRASISSDKISEYTRIINKTIEIIESNGDKINDTFAIRQNEKGEYEFYWGDITPEAAESREENWRKNMYIQDKYDTADAVVAYLRSEERYCIP